MRTSFSLFKMEASSVAEMSGDISLVFHVVYDLNGSGTGVGLLGASQFSAANWFANSCNAFVYKSTSHNLFACSTQSYFILSLI